ncbi:solute carrier family 66 member 2 isoform X1 [Ixodes scapularis]|uniref:solute carrier family 66 member 2 isoform X1 n=1 Tax=Ixodes scapularis TaxID=6945 RepID=UPI001C38530D|nr:solute carrier family 66 member 2 isoform X1 [Ixodes scapularis]
MSTWLELAEEGAVSPAQLVSWGASTAIIFGGVVPYVPQYREIRRTNNAEGFSPFVCLALLVANTLRILFWFGHPFELPLLAQSLVMTACMLAMLRLCVHTRSQSLVLPQPSHTFTGGRPFLTLVVPAGGSDGVSCQRSPLPTGTLWEHPWRQFWAWTDFLSYLEFMASFALCTGALLYLFLDCAPLVEALGFLALLTEALLGLPQFWRNLRNRSTRGMSNQMVLLWTLGDVFKTVYFVVRSAPTQFWVCGGLQVALDVAILLQVVWYWRKCSTS